MPQGFRRHYSSQPPPWTALTTRSRSVTCCLSADSLAGAVSMAPHLAGRNFPVREITTAGSPFKRHAVTVRRIRELRASMAWSVACLGIVERTRVSGNIVGSAVSMPVTSTSSVLDPMFHSFAAYLGFPKFWKPKGNRSARACHQLKTASTLLKSTICPLSRKHDQKICTAR
ncbi:hypothetical protein H4V98_004318 [Polaromonas sp. CG_23.6]|nr:hypothetical protein [Polaromonas sp. CG_23.6]